MNLINTHKTIKLTPIVAAMPVLKVIGMGGGGCNAINRMIELGISGVEFIGANTDKQALQNCLAPTRVQLGPKVTRGLGAGGNPAVGEAAAEESYRELAAALHGADMVFLTAGMGGGTGTGSISVASKIARALGAVTIAIVTTPFSFEMGRRQKNANEGLSKLRQHTNTLITIPNDRLLYVAPRDLPMEVAFRLADDVLRQGIQGISELITQPGMMNVDFAHVRALMQRGGGSLMAIGQGQGERKAQLALEQALHHPLLESISLDSSSGMIVNFTGGPDLSFSEVAESLTHLQAQAGNVAEIIPGVVYNDNMEGRVQVILIVTGIGATPIEQAMQNIPMVQKATPEIITENPAQNSIRQPVFPASAPSSYPADQPPAVEMTSQPINLDLPAFMRRRNRYQSQ